MTPARRLLLAASLALFVSHGQAVFLLDGLPVVRSDARQTQSATAAEEELGAAAPHGTVVPELSWHPCHMDRQALGRTWAETRPVLRFQSLSALPLYPPSLRYRHLAKPLQAM